MLSLLGHNTKELCPIFVFLHFIIQQNDKHCDHNATFSQWGLKIEREGKVGGVSQKVEQGRYCSYIRKEVGCRLGNEEQTVHRGSFGSS